MHYFSVDCILCEAPHFGIIHIDMSVEDAQLVKVLASNGSNFVTETRTPCCGCPHYEVRGLGRENQPRLPSTVEL
jgi:hypothetical protein